MTGKFTTAFDNMYASLPEARCKVRVKTHVYQRALSSGVEQTREADALSTYDVTNCNVRLKAIDEDARYPLKKGSVVDVQFGDSGEWQKLRIESRRNTAGIISLGMNTEHE